MNCLVQKIKIKKIVRCSSVKQEKTIISKVSHFFAYNALGLL